MAPKKSGPIDLIKAYADSPMAIVNQILASGNFAQAPEIPVREGEVPIERELTPLIKALYSAGVRLLQEHDALIDKKERTLLEAGNKGSHGAINAIYEHQISTVIETYQTLNFLFLTTLKQYLGVPPGTQVALREGYQAVMLKNGFGFDGSHMLSISLNDLPSLLGFSLIDPMMGIPIGFSGMGHEGCADCLGCGISPLEDPVHDLKNMILGSKDRGCKGCPDYDDCNHPSKN
jgi:hypothetical protein